MATVYWVGGTGTWNTSSTTNWSTTSGGAGGASAPTSSDNVIIDSASGTVIITCSGAVCANLTIACTTANTVSIYGTLDVVNLFIAALPAAGCQKLAMSGTVNVSGTFSVSGTSENNRVGILLDPSYGTATITSTNLNAASISLSNVDFYGINAGGAAAPFSGINIGDAGGNTNITATAPKTVYWSLLAGGFFTSIAFATSSGGTPALANFPLPQDTVIIDNTGLTQFNLINFWVGFYLLPNITSTRTLHWGAEFTSATLFGNVTIPAPINLSSGRPICSGVNKTINVTTFSGLNINSIGTITYPISGLNTGLTINAGTFKVTASALFMIPSAGVLLNKGTLDITNVAIYGYFFSSSNSNVRSIIFGTSGRILLDRATTATNTANVFVLSNATNFSYTGTSSIILGRTYSPRSMNISIDNAMTESQALNFSFGSATPVLTINGLNVTKNLNATLLNGSIVNASGIVVYGNLTIGTSVSSVSPVTLAGASDTKTITTAGKSFTLNFNGNCIWEFLDALTTPTRTLIFNAGTVKLKSGTTNTISGLQATSTTLKYLASTTAGSQATLSVSSGTVSPLYLNIKDSNATGGATFDASGVGNVDGGNNTGWFGFPPIVSAFKNFLAFF